MSLSALGHGAELFPAGQFHGISCPSVSCRIHVDAMDLNGILSFPLARHKQQCFALARSDARPLHPHFGEACAARCLPGLL